MKQTKGFLQRASLWSGMVSLVIAAVCAVFLYIKVDETGYNNPVSASLLASVFFFIFVGFLLIFIGKCNLPSFSFDEPKDK